jgi:hypothetical protein
MPPVDHALQLAALGLRVFPVCPGSCAECQAKPEPERGKHPRVKWKARATTDPALLRHWWRKWPDSVVGAPTGAQFVALDLDFARHVEAVAWYEANRASLPPTRTHRTPSGGLHLLFQRHPLFRSSAGKIAAGVDTKGICQDGTSGGYICWYPAHGHAVLHEGPMARVPEWLAAALVPAAPARAALPVPAVARQRERKLAGIIRAIARAHEGQRNTVAFWGACRLAELAAANALSRTEAIEITIAAAAAAGLPASEARTVAQSALKRIGMS